MEVETRGRCVCGGGGYRRVGTCQGRHTSVSALEISNSSLIPSDVSEMPLNNLFSRNV